MKATLRPALASSVAPQVVDLDRYELGTDPDGPGWFRGGQLLDGDPASTGAERRWEPTWSM